MSIGPQRCGAKQLCGYFDVQGGAGFKETADRRKNRPARTSEVLDQPHLSGQFDC